MSSMASSSSSKGQITNPPHKYTATQYMSSQFYMINFYVEIYEMILW